MDRALLTLYAATFVFSFALAMGNPLVPQALTVDHGASLAFVGLVAGVYGVMQIVLRLPMGDMADRRGRKPSLLLAFACVGAAGALFVAAPSALWFLPAMALYGFAGGIFWVAANSYLFDRADGTSVPRATSDYAVAAGIGFLAGPLAGGFVADRFGFRAGFASFLAGSVVGLALVATLPEAPVAPRVPPVGSPYARAWKLLRHRALVVSAVGTFCYSVQFNAFSTFFPLHVRALFASSAIVGLLLSLRQLSGTVVRWGLPRAIERFGAARVLLVGVGVAATMTALVPFVTSLPALVAFALISGTAMGIMIPANLTLVAEGAPVGERGLANGIYGTMIGVGAVTPYALGALAHSFGLPWAFWGASAVSLAGLAALLVALARSPPAAPAPG